MVVKLFAYGIARDILKSSSQEVDLSEGSTVADLKQELVNLYPDFEKLQSLKFAINEDYSEDSQIIQPTDEVVIIPPVSGG